MFKGEYIMEEVVNELISAKRVYVTAERALERVRAEWDEAETRFKAAARVLDAAQECFEGALDDAVERYGRALEGE